MKTKLLLFIFLPLSAFSQITDSQLQTLCKVWGVYKYFDPTVKSGKIDWDRPLLHILDHKDELKIDKALDILTDSLSIYSPNVDKAFKTCELDPRFQWIEKDIDISEKMKAYLLKISQNTGLGHYHQREKAGAMSYLSEKTYPEVKIFSKKHYLLGVFRLYNAMEYFSSYRYFVTKQREWELALENAIRQVNSKDLTLTEYNIVLYEMINGLKDGHGNIFSNERFAYIGRYKLPYEFEIIDNKVFVKKANLRNKTLFNLGDEILGINGENTNDAINRLRKVSRGSNISAQNHIIAYLLSCVQGKNNILKIKDSKDQKTKERNVKGITEFQQFLHYKREKKHYKIDKNTAYINLGYLQRKKLKKYLQSYHDIQNLVIDLREYPNSQIGDVIFEYLFPDTFSLKQNWYYQDSICTGKFQLNTKNAPSKVNTPKSKSILNKHYKGKITIIVGNNTLSRGEILTMWLQQLPNVTTVGDTTAGSLGYMNFCPLPYNIRVSYTEGMFVYPDLSINKPIGVKIDIPIKNTYQSILKGEDIFIKKAIESINKKSN
jgi:carboxyl-terminal processing protease